MSPLNYRLNKTTHTNIQSVKSSSYHQIHMQQRNYYFKAFVHELKLVFLE